MKMFVITSLLLTRYFFAIAAHPQITAGPYFVARQAGNDVCGYYSSDDNSTSISVHYDILTLLTDTMSAYTLSCPLGEDCAVATTTTPAVKFCASPGVGSEIPITTAFDYGNWPVDGCTTGQGCWLANLLLNLLRSNAKIYYQKHAILTHSRQIHLRRRYDRAALVRDRTFYLPSIRS